MTAHDLFVGRTHELHEIAAFILGYQSVSIVGPPGSGKTALLTDLMRPATWAPLGRDATLFAYLDCAALDESAPAETFRRVVVALTTAVRASGLQPEPSLDAALDQPTRLAFEAALRQLNRRGRRVVLILDRFERLSANRQHDLAFFNALRSATARFRLVFLTASQRPLIELTYSGRAQDLLSSPFFNIFATVYLGLLPEDEARRLIRVCIGAPIDSSAEDFVYALVGGQPGALQIACRYMRETPGDHTLIEQRTVQACAAHFRACWCSLTPAERAMMRALAGQDETAARPVGDLHLSAAGVRRGLVQKGLLVREGASYRCTARAWAQFVAEHDHDSLA